MNMNDLQVALPSPEIHPGDADPNAIYTFQNPRHQDFALPYPIIKYIFSNPTPKAWKKLIKTCKYFYLKNPIYPIDNFQSRREEEWFGDEGGIIYSNRDLAKLWLHASLYANSFNQPSSNAISSLIPKLGKCDIRDILLRNQNLTFEEYQFLTSSGTMERFNFSGNCTVKYSDHTFVTFDKLLENLPNIEMFIYFNVNPSMFKPDTVKKMVKILQQFKKLEYLKLLHLAETFDISSIANYLLENQTAEIVLHFHGEFSDAFKLELDKCFQKVISNPPKELTIVQYPGMNRDQLEEYKKLYQ